MTSSVSRSHRARSPTVADRLEGKARSRSPSKNIKIDSRSVIGCLKGNPLASNVPSKSSKELARGDKSESSGEQLQPDKKTGKGTDSSFEDPPSTPRRRENLSYPLKNPDSPPSDPRSERNSTPVPTSAPFVRLGSGPPSGDPTGDAHDQGGHGFVPPPPPGLEKPNVSYFKISSPASSNDPSSSSRTQSRSETTTPPNPQWVPAVITPPPVTRVDQPNMFSGVDPAAWYAMVQAQWQMCDAYRLAGQVQLEAQQREHALLLQHQFENMCNELKSRGETHALKVDFEQQLADLRRRAETSQAAQEDEIRRQKAEAEDLIMRQRAAYEEEQRKREEWWKAERARAEDIFRQEKERSAAEAAAQARAVEEERARLIEMDRQQQERINADAMAKEARIKELSDALRDSELKHEKFADDTLRNIDSLEKRCLEQEELGRRAAAENNASTNNNNSSNNTATFGNDLSSVSHVSSVPSPLKSPELAGEGSSQRGPFTITRKSRHRPKWR